MASSMSLSENIKSFGMKQVIRPWPMKTITGTGW